MKSHRVEWRRPAGWEADEIGVWVNGNEGFLLFQAYSADYAVDGCALIVAHIVLRAKPPKTVEQVPKPKRCSAGSTNKILPS
jgi:hypothetical protein